MLLDDGPEWTYRVSVADLAGLQPFSRFDGVDRHLTFLGPGSLSMTVNGTPSTLVRHEDIAFAGEDDVMSEPSESAARDLNIMVRRHARTLKARRTQGMGIVTPGEAAVTLWISLEPGGTVAGQSVGELDVALLRAGEDFRIDGAGLVCAIAQAPR